MVNTKKTLAIFLVALLLLSACGSNNKNAALNYLCEPLNNEAITLNWCNKEYDGTMDKKENGDIALSLTSNELQTPITFLVTNEQLTVKTSEYETTCAHNNSPAVLIYSSFKTLSNGEVSFRGDKANITMDCFHCIVNCKSRKIESLSFPNGSINFKITT